MSHFAVIAPPFYSHVRALQALAQRLIARGHRITFIQQAEVAALLSDAAVGFHAIGLASHPAGTLDRTLQLAAHPGGLGILRLIRDMASSTDMLCRELPDALRALAVDGVIVDQMAPAGGLVAEALQLPFVSVACALPVNREAHFPLPVMPFLWGTSSAARERFASSEKIYDWLMLSAFRTAVSRISACRRWRKSASCRTHSTFRAANCPHISTPPARCANRRPPQQRRCSAMAASRAFSPPSAPCRAAAMGCLKLWRKPVVNCRRSC